ncbi:fimbrial chaperone [Salmonella enterica]|nr:fimbrial chaperone [Salmonella enterica subsp. enterica serovar Anatum]EGG5319507.1 fimbrial chaperone [Salmonella enterica]EDR3966853.1 fimbrial chaperone [Salmonella enterica subsp. enterica serovar Anatum]EDS1621245.1 fimbrial chaperone [Salmonella enterica subsp. enterica serovar Anatum]EDT2183261.1 fimbrial chaperone [Salmonella enterica subsp. enterica serovar Anatum]
MLCHLRTAFTVITLTGTLLSNVAWADIVISGTRIVYRGAQKDVNVRLENKGSRPLLVQTWLDTGNDNTEPGAIKVPFNATPPVSRIDPKKGQTIKIMYTGSQTLPSDRESVFWFNVLEVPPKANKNENSAAKNTLQLAFRTRIKLFYRPQGLGDLAGEAPAKLTWRMKHEQGKSVVTVNNPTPYFVSFNSIELESTGKKYIVDGQMAAPLTETSFTLKTATTISSGKINYSFINDFGGIINATASLQ